MSMKSSDFKPKKYDDGRTKQAFKDSTDVNRLLQRHAKAGTLSALAKVENRFGDFQGFDFHHARNMIAQGQTIFEQLPSEVRREFDQDAQKFFNFVNDPEKQGKLDELLPALAQPGRQMPTANPKAAANAAEGRASEPQASENQPADPQPAAPSPPPAEE